MKKPTVLILGATGMLGSITLDVFAGSSQFNVIATCRSLADAKALRQAYPKIKVRVLDAEKATASELVKVLQGADWAVNAIGIIKPYIHDDNAKEVKRATRVNALFPHLLAEAAAKTNTRVLQIATDCVYSGQKGQYVETDVHDALDVYGKSKSLGEAHLDTIYHLRCSIIGPELKGHLSLLDWFLGNPQGAELNGFTNHQWNGVTTLHFARLAEGIIKADLELPHAQHIIPGNLITKANLLKAFAKDFKRSDMKIKAVEAPTVIDRTLVTADQTLNQRIWQAAGYDVPPTIEQMVTELAEYNFPQQGATS